MYRSLSSLTLLLVSLFLVPCAAISQQSSAAPNLPVSPQPDLPVAPQPDPLLLTSVSDPSILQSSSSQQQAPSAPQPRHLRNRRKRLLTRKTTAAKPTAK